MKILKEIVKKFLPLVLVVTFLGVFLAFLEVALISKGGKFIESLSAKNLLQLKYHFKNFLLITFASLLSQITMGGLFAYTKKKLTRHGEFLLLSHFFRIRPDVLIHYKAGDIADRISRDIHSITTFFDYQYLELVRGLSFLVFSSIYVFFLNWIFGMLSVFYILLFLIVSAILTKYVEMAYYNYYNISASKDALLFEGITGLNHIKSLFAFDYFKEKYNKFLDKTVNLAFKADILIILLFSVSISIMLLFVVGFFAVGMLLTTKGVMSLGDFLTIFALFLLNSNQFSKVMNSISSIRRNLGGIRRIDELLNEPTEPEPPDLKFEREIVLKDIYLSFNGKEVIKGLELGIKKGEFITIVGKTGIGKTTFLSILCGFLRPEKGDILLDGYRLDENELVGLRKLIGYMPQFSFIIDGTLRENITFGESFDEGRVKEVIAKAGLEDFVSKNGGTIDFQLKESGKNLSGGEIQRINLARVILRDKPIYVFDEPTSNVDAKTEEIIISTLKELRGQGKTVIVVSHKSKVVEISDKVYEFKDGKLNLIQSN